MKLGLAFEADTPMRRGRAEVGVEPTLQRRGVEPAVMADDELIRQNHGCSGYAPAAPDPS